MILMSFRILVLYEFNCIYHQENNISQNKQFAKSWKFNKKNINNLGDINIK